jgi:hypothetical protein
MTDSQGKYPIIPRIALTQLDLGKVWVEMKNSGLKIARRTGLWSY